jgi:hypothetical protein
MVAEARLHAACAPPGSRRLAELRAALLSPELPALAEALPGVSTFSTLMWLSSEGPFSRALAHVGCSAVATAFAAASFLGMILPEDPGAGAGRDALGIEARAVLLPAEELYGRFRDEAQTTLLVDALSLVGSLPALLGMHVAGGLPDDDSDGAQHALNTLFIVASSMVVAAQLNAVGLWTALVSTASTQRNELFAHWYADRGHAAYMAARAAHARAWLALTLLLALLPLVLYLRSDALRALLPAAAILWTATQHLALFVGRVRRCAWRPYARPYARPRVPTAPTCARRRASGTGGVCVQTSRRAACGACAGHTVPGLRRRGVPARRRRCAAALAA